MEFKKDFNCLAKKYGLEYKYQEFQNCFGGNWFVFTHSLFNDSGCFTVHCLPQRGEIDCYFSESFSYDRSRLCENLVNVFDIEKEIWLERQKLWIFRNPFCYWNSDKFIKTLLEVINISLEKASEFAGLKIKCPKD